MLAYHSSGNLRACRAQNIIDIMLNIAGVI
jgi:hypothetical protein